MLLLRSLGALLAAMVLSTFPVSGQQDDQAPSVDFETIDAYVEAQMSRARIPGLALVVVRGDSVVHVRGFGVADPSGRSVTPETPFILGSTSKSFTALAVMLLVDQGRLELDAPVLRYIPWFRVADPRQTEDITVRSLLNHTSGISVAEGLKRLADGDTSATAIERHVRALRNVRLMRPPGSGFEYSNANYGVLGMIVQQISGSSYEAFVQEEVFHPLQMTHSHTSEASARNDGLATGHRMWFGFPIATRNMPFVRGLLPGGYIITSAGDMASYLGLFLNNGMYSGQQLVSTESIAELVRPAARMSERWHYGMGWVVGERNNEPVLWHNGSTPDFYSYMALLPESGWGVAVLANASTMVPVAGYDAVSFGVVDMLRGREPTPSANHQARRTWLLIYVLSVLVLVGQLLWVGISVTKRKSWLTSVSAWPPSLSTEIWKTGMPLVFNCAWAFALFFLIPAVQQVPLSVALLYVPDLMLVLVMSAAVAITWGVARAGFRMRASFVAARDVPGP